MTTGQKLRTLITGTILVFVLMLGAFYISRLVAVLIVRWREGQF